MEELIPDNSKLPEPIEFDTSVIEDSEKFIENHAIDLEKFFRKGLNYRIIEILKKWMNSPLDFEKPLQVENFSRIVQSSNDVKLAIEEFNKAQIKKRLSRKNRVKEVA